MSDCLQVLYSLPAEQNGGQAQISEFSNQISNFDLLLLNDSLIFPIMFHVVFLKGSNSSAMLIVGARVDGRMAPPSPKNHYFKDLTPGRSTSKIFPQVFDEILREIELGTKSNWICWEEKLTFL